MGWCVVWYGVLCNVVSWCSLVLCGVKTMICGVLWYYVVLYCVVSFCSVVWYGRVCVNLLWCGVFGVV